MDEPRKTAANTSLGQMQVLQDESPVRAGEATHPWPNVTSIIYEWTPSPALTTQLPPDFTLRLRCITANDGVRRFYPVDSFENFIAVAFTAGLALLSNLTHATPQQRHSYRAMYLLFQRVRRTKEHLGNALLNTTSLRVSRVGQDSADERSILPGTVGLNQQGQGEEWSVDRLVAEGRQEAREAGIEHPSESTCLHYGLIAAATMNPLTIPANKVPALVRQALYADAPVDESLEPEVVEVVIERTLATVHQHLDEPAASFDAWFLGGNNSFVRQIAKRKLLHGGQIDQQVVRHALLDLGWQAYQYVTDCINTVMRVVENLILEPLTMKERTCLEQMHLSQPHFGNLPLVLLAERIPFIKGILWDIFNDPSDQRGIGVLYRLLDWYGDIARKRRHIDRTVKQRRPAKRIEGEKTPLVVSLPEPVEGGEIAETPDASETVSGEPATPDAADVPKFFVEIAEWVCNQHQLRCRCGLQDWRHRLVGSGGVTATIEHACAACHYTTTSTISLKEIRKAFGTDD